METGRPPETLDELRELVQHGIDLIGAGFEAPDDDWMATMFIQDAEGVEILGLLDDLFATHNTKDMLGEMLRLRVAAGAFRYALLVNTHGVRLDLMDEHERNQTIMRIRSGAVRVEQLPDAYEALVLSVGDADEEQVWSAYIERTPKMINGEVQPIRTLAPWHHLSEEDGARFTGRFAGMNEYMKAVRA